MQEIVDLKEKAFALERTYQLQGQEKERFERMATILTNKEAPTLPQIKEALTTTKEAYQPLHLLYFGEPLQFCKADGEEETSWLEVADLVEGRYIWGVYERVLADSEVTRATELLTTMIEQDKDDLLLKGWEAKTMAKLAIKCYEKWL